MKNSFLKKLLAITSIGLFATTAFALSPPYIQFFWSVQDGKLLDPNGNPFIFRGVTVEQNLAPDKALQAIKDAAVLGANAVQVEINGNVYRQEQMITGAQLTAIIETCKASKVVCVLEPNDVAGYPDAAGAGIPATAASFWNWPGIREAIQGQQRYIILGFGNQYLSYMPAQEYVARMSTYLNDFTSYPLNKFVIMVDASGWGQDADKAMYEFAKQWPNNGANSNLPYIIYSVDMFSAYTNPQIVRDYIASFAAIKAPLVIGGFGPTVYYHPHNIGLHPAVVYDLPEDSVMYYAEQYGTGYFGWSWSGNRIPGLDIVNNWNANSLTTWGNLLFNSSAGIKATAKIASIYNSSSSSTSSSSSSSSINTSSSSTSTSSSKSSSSASANRDPIAVIESYIVERSCGSVYGELTGRASTDPDGDALTYEWTVAGDSKIYTGPNLTYYMRGGPYYNFTLTVRDGRGGVATTSKYLRHEGSDQCYSSAKTSSSVPRSSSSIYSSSSVYSSSSIRSTSSSSKSSSSSAQITAKCSYVINSQWTNGFTASIRIQNNGTKPIVGWNVNWQYADPAHKVTNFWNANISGSNPYSANNLQWNSTIQPGQTIEFGFQGSKPTGNASAPTVTGSICK